MRNGLQTSPRLSCRLVPTGYGTLGAVKLSIERRPGETGFHFFGYTARWGNIQKTCDFAGLLSYIRLRRVILPSAVIFVLRRVVLLRSFIRLRRVVLPSAVIFGSRRVVLLRSFIRLRRVILLCSDIRLTPSGIRFASLGGE